MSFLDWLYSSYPNPHVDGEWGPLHISVLVLAIAFIVCSSILLKNKSEKTKRIVLFVMAAIILLFGIIRRVVGLIKTTDYSTNKILKILALIIFQKLLLQQVLI